MTSMPGQQLASSSVEADRKLLRAMFDAAVEAARPWNHIARFLPDPPPGRTIIIGAGKAASQMAAAVERLWNGPLDGLVITGKGQGLRCQRIEVIEASHPVPDESGLAATSRMLDRVRGLSRDDLVLALISGGGSAMMPAPAGDSSVTRACPALP